MTSSPCIKIALALAALPCCLSLRASAFTPLLRGSSGGSSSSSGGGGSSCSSSTRQLHATLLCRHRSSSGGGGSVIISSSRRCGQPRAASSADDEATDWDDAMASLRKRQEAISPEDGESALPAEPMGSAPAPAPGPAPGPGPVSPPPTPNWLKTEGTTTPPMSGGSASGFRYERKDDTSADDFIAGLDDRDQAFVRNAILYGGRALTFITIASLAFYIYIGVSGGITDGFDRFSEPIEDIRDTMAREGTDVF